MEEELETRGVRPLDIVDEEDQRVGTAAGRMTSGGEQKGGDGLEELLSIFDLTRRCLRIQDLELGELRQQLANQGQLPQGQLVEAVAVLGPADPPGVAEQIDHHAVDAVG